MPQGAIKKKTSAPKKDRNVGKTKRGGIVRAPKKKELVEHKIKNQKITAAITANIEKEMSTKLRREGTSLHSIKPTENDLQGIKFNPKKQNRIAKE